MRWSRYLGDSAVDNTEIVKEGTWLYAGTVSRKIRIAREYVWPGTGDAEDPPEIRDDHYVECFAIWYETDNDKFKAGGGYCATLQEAISAVERRVGSTVRWS